MQVIFLDIDGVLNGHQAHENGFCGTYPECVKRFNRVLDAVPDAMIVVTSAWRYLIHCESMTLGGFENLLLTHGVKCHRRILDLTRKDREGFGDTREIQIAEWLMSNNPKTWVIIDDLPLVLDRFVRTNGETGLTDADVDKILQHFAPANADSPSSEEATK